MSRNHRRVSDEGAPGPGKPASAGRVDDKFFSKYRVDKVASKESIYHTCLAWLSDGSALVAGEVDGSIQTYSLDKIAVTWSLEAATNSSVSHIAPNPQRPSLITAAFKDSQRSHDSTLRTFDVRSKPTHNQKLTTRTHGDLLALAFHPDGTRLLAVRRSGKITLYDTRKTNRKDGGPAVPLKERPLPYDINDAQFTPDGRAIIAAYGVTVGSGTVGGLRILSAEDLSDVAEHPAHVLPAISLTQAAPRGRRHLLALGGNDCAATLWDVRSMAVVRPLPISNKPVRRVHLSADGSMLAATGTHEPKSGAGDFDCIDIHVIDHDDIYAACHHHRVEQLFSRLMDLCWSPRHGVLAACGDGIESHQRSKDVSTVYVYRQ
eukprot:jgi/Ulvmu1/2356/UM013_0204.1